MAELLITVLQALQLVALAPCLFVIFFLALTALHLKRVALPILYFMTLACSFLLPLLPLFPPLHRQAIEAGLLFGESLAPALSFLLVLQFLQGRLPAPAFWLVLLVPLVGGGSFIYGAVFLEEVCFFDEYCTDPVGLKSLYSIFSAAMIFLLLIVYYARTGQVISRHDTSRVHKYWLMMALIMLSLQLMVIDLAHLSGMLDTQNAIFIATVIRIAFIYLVLTSLFRVFDSMFELDVQRIPTFAGRKGKTADYAAESAQIIEAMEQRKFYREMRLNRELMAERLGMPEHQLSRIVNSRFGKNFNEFVNQYRVEEAKQRLQGETTAITTIAFEVGFNSIASFNRVFKELSGLSPTEFRHQGGEGAKAGGD